MKTFKLLIAGILFMVVGIFAVNYFTIESTSKLNTDTDIRNNGISYSIHYKYYIVPSTLVFDLKEVPLDKAPVDVFRVFLQSSEALKDKTFKYVEISYKGKTKFMLQGDYFSTLGNEYGLQNPMYTTRTFPENLLDQDGNRAYSVWGGGMIGVLSSQIKDFNDFTDKWYLEEITGERNY